MKLFFMLAFLMVCTLVWSQIARDSSFTDNSELQKVRKKYPDAKLVTVHPDQSVTLIKNRVYTKIGQRQLHFDTYLLNSLDKKPAVVLIHGGGWKSGDREMMRPLAMALASKGFSCFAVEYRLSPEAKYPAGIEDVLTATQYLKDKADEFNIDPGKMAVLGTSSGGQMASLIGTKYSDLVQAVVNLDGILAFHHPDSEEGSAAAAWLGGSFAEKPGVWAEASPLAHVSSKSAPVLFIGSQCKRFQAGREDLIKLLNSHSIYSQTQIIENSPHTFWMFEQWFNPVVGFITSFLNQQFYPQQFIQSK